MTPLVAKIVWALCCIGWFVIRLPHQRRARRTPVIASRRGARELVLLAISLSGFLFVPLLYVATGVPRFADYPFQPLQGVIGTLLVVAALVLFRLTHKQLGRSWSVTLETRRNHRLVTDGVYRLVRHPMYSAFFLWALAQAFLLPNLVAGPAGLVGFGILFAFRVGKEEEMMIETFGEEYRAYMQRTARILPGLY